jgi:hypothetical protein
VACAPQSIQIGDPGYLNQREVVFQVCVASNVLFDSGVLSVSTVKAGSFGGGAVYQSGTSSLGEPIFMGKIAHRRNVRGVLLLGKSRITHVFLATPSQKYSDEKWTDWQRATSFYAADKNFNIGLMLLNGAPLPVSDPRSSEKIFIRYREMSLKEYYKLAEDLRMSMGKNDIPVCIASN